MDSDECKQLIQNNIDFEFYRTLFEPIRSEILVFLAINGEMNIGEIAEHFPQNRSVISRHLDLMNRYGMVEKRKESRNTYYTISKSEIIQKFDETSANIKRLMSLDPKAKQASTEQ